MQRLENGRFEHLDTQAGLAPVPSLSVVANVIVSSEPDPLRNRAVLLLGLGQLLLGSERLVARHLVDVAYRVGQW